MPAIRTVQEPYFRYTPGFQDFDYSQSVHLDSARAEFSLRKRPAAHAPAPAYPSFVDTPSFSPQPHIPVTSARTAPQPGAKPKKKKASNAFILYRSDVLSRQLLPKSVTHQNTASIMIADRWREEPAEVKQKYYDLAAAKKKMADEEYARAYDIPEVPKKAARRVKKERKETVPPEPVYPAFSFPQSMLDAQLSPFLQSTSLPYFPNPEHPSYTIPFQPGDFSSPSSVAESSFPPTPALSDPLISLELSQEFSGLFDPSLSTVGDFPPELTFNSNTFQNTSETNGGDSLLNELLLPLDVEVETQPFDLPNIFDNIPLVFNSRTPTPTFENPSLIMADTEDVAWSYVRNNMERHPAHACPGLGLFVPLMEEGSQLQQPLLDFSTLSITSPSVQQLSSFLSPATAKEDGQALPEARRLAIPPGSSSGWSNAFKEFASGNTW